ncbi:MAG: dTMP kinase [Cytophagales bacterium]|nr:dTMP kinase [Cytophagales bacterium]
MEKKSHFIVIEGLDGSGKSTATKRLAHLLETQYGKKVKQTFEPHDDSVGGQYIRQVLTKKITDFHPRVLPLSFAANRLDHCSRVINPWLATSEDHVVLCDRYYLSSLVYQSSDDFDMESVYQLNEKAIRPDLILFFDVSDEICYQRMAHRNEDRELFEENLAVTRTKFEAAKSFLINKGENIIDIDASGTPEEVVNLLIKAIAGHFTALQPIN